MTERKKRRRGRVALGLFLLTASTTSSLAQLTTTTWNGSEDNDWSNASNWDNGVPTSDVQAVINTLPSAGIGEPAEAFDLSVNNDGYLNVLGSLTVDGLNVGDSGDAGDLATVNISTNLEPNFERAFLRADVVSIGGSSEGEVVVGNRGVLVATFIDIDSGGQLVLEGDSPGPLVLATSIRMSSSGEIVFSQSGSIDVFPVIFGDSGKLLVESGSTRLSLDSSGFAGTTEITGGTLLVDTTLGGNISVSGGTLSGNGNATGAITVASGGTVAPGNSVGTLQTGDVTFQGNSTFAIEIDADGNADMLQSSGTVTLEGGTVSVTADSYDEDVSFTIITADTAVEGSFSDVTSTAFIDYGLLYDTTSVTLTQTVSQSFSDVARSSNHASIARIFDGFDPDHEIVQNLFGSISEDDARDAYDQLSGQAHASLKGALAENGQLVVGAVQDRFYDESSAPVASGGAGGWAGPAYSVGSEHGIGLWLTGYGNWSKTDATKNTASMTNNAGGLVAGIDRRIGDHALIGLMGGYGHTAASVDDLGSDSDADGYTLGAYGRLEAGAAAFDAGALYTWYDIETSRTITNPAYERLTADYDAGAWQVFAEASYDVALERLLVTPFAGVSYVALHTDGFSESGGPSALTAASETTETTFTTLGVRGAATVFDTVSIHSMAGWRHAFGDINPVSVFTLDGSDPFSIIGAPIAEDAFVTEFGLNAAVTETATIGVSYQGQIADDANAHGVFGRVFVRF